MLELINDVEMYVKNNIQTFHTARINKLTELNLKKLLKSKNPYLYKAKNLNNPGEIIYNIASAFLSSAEESMFGDWLEGLAIFVASKVYGGRKSAAESIDLEMDKDGIHYFISIKSGPKWSNANSKKKLIDHFNKAKRIYRTSNNHTPCEVIEGCCYGVENKPQKDTHIKLCGQKFWEFISGSDTLYLDIIEPLGIDSLKRNEEYKVEFDKMITRFTSDFVKEYCDDTGSILWDKIVRLNSGHKRSER